MFNSSNKLTSAVFGSLIAFQKRHRAPTVVDKVGQVLFYLKCHLTVKYNSRRRRYGADVGKWEEIK